MKTIIKIYIFIFLVALVGMFFFAFSFINIFCEFELLSSNVVFYASLITASVFAVGCLITAIILMKSERKTKFGHWLSVNSAKLILAYVLLQLFFLSIKSEVLLTIEEMKELLSLEWTILGISITAFLIWSVVTIEYLQKRKPQKPQSTLPIKTLIYLQEKENFYSSATSLLSNVYILLANLTVICIVTGMIYVTSRTATLFSQSVLVFGLFLSTNTILGLILDILKPFNEKKKEILEESKTTEKDVELQNAIFEDTEELIIAIDAIDNLSALDDEEKKKVKCELLNGYISKYDNQASVE